VICGLVCSVAVTPAMSSELDMSLNHKAKWRSFGIDDWAQHDPFERSKPGAERQPYSKWHLNAQSNSIDQLLDLIAFAEAGSKQYNAVHMSAQVLPLAPPTRLTISEIYEWISATPKQHHAIGRYQFIPSTLRSLVRRAGLSKHETFSQTTQDRLARILLRDAGFNKVKAGTLSRERFMDNLAGIWAGLPLKSGHSRYRGIAGNRATISRVFFEAQIRNILG